MGTSESKLSFSPNSECDQTSPREMPSRFILAGHISPNCNKTSKSKSGNENETIGDKNKSSEDLKTSSASQS